MTNTRSKALEKLGLDYETLSLKFPKLIYAHFSGFGDKGPEKDRPGFDVAAFWARSGALVEWGALESSPNRPHPGFGDGTVSSALLSGILAALYKRTQTGKGDKIRASLFGTALWYNSTGILMGQPAYGHQYPKSKFNQTNPFSNLYQTKDKDWILISSPDYANRKNGIFDIIGLSELKNNPKYATLETCYQNGNMREIVEILIQAFAKTDTKTILNGLGKMDIVYEKLANPKDLYTAPQAWANGYLHELKLENGDTVVLPTNLIKFNNMEPPEFNLGPQLGADTVSILKELGYSDDTIETMQQNNSIKAKKNINRQQD